MPLAVFVASSKKARVILGRAVLAHISVADSAPRLYFNATSMRGGAG